MLELKKKSECLTLISRSIAVFVDYHCQEIGINELENNQHFNYEYIARYIHSLGNVIIMRAYGNWNYFKIAGKKLKEYGLELIHTIRKKNRIKTQDNTDIIMTMDIVDIYHKRSDINTFVIISGDIDFLDAVLKVKANPENKVIIISEENSLNHQYYGVVDKIITYQQLRKLFEFQ